MLPKLAGAPLVVAGPDEAAAVAVACGVALLPSGSSVDLTWVKPWPTGGGGGGGGTPEGCAGAGGLVVPADGQKLDEVAG